MISDGVHIYADGKVYDTVSSAWLNFNVCLNAADNSVVTLGTGSNQTQCNALANSFSLSNSGQADLTYYEVTGVTPGMTIPGPSSNASQTQPSTATVNALMNVYSVTNFSSSATPVSAN